MASQSEESGQGIGRRIRDARSAAGLSTEALARRSGVSSAVLADLEAGRSDPSVRTVQRVASALNVSPGWLAWAGATPCRTAADGPDLQKKLSALADAYAHLTTLCGDVGSEEDELGRRGRLEPEAESVTAGHQARDHRNALDL